MFSFRSVGLSLVLAASATLALPSTASGQDENVRHGRKYKAPPVTSHVVVTVVKPNGKPISNAAVIFHPMKDGKDDGNLEVKTDPEGKATIDVIATGSAMRVQVIANGYATFGEDYQVDTPTKEIAVNMVRPREQVSAYKENTGAASQRKAGVQEPIRPKVSTTPPPPLPHGPVVTPPATPPDTATPPATTQPAPPPQQ